MVSLYPKLNDSELDKKQGDQAQFLPKKDSRKRKLDFILLKISYCSKTDFIFSVTQADGLRNKTISSSVVQEFFSSVSKS